MPAALAACSGASIRIHPRATRPRGLGPNPERSATRRGPRIPRKTVLGRCACFHISSHAQRARVLRACTLLVLAACLGMICCITLTGRSTTDGVGHEFLVSNVRVLDLFSSSCHGHRNEIMWSNKHTFKLRRTSSVPAALGVSRDTIPPPCTRALPRGRVGSGRIGRSRCTDGPAQTTRHRLTGFLGLCAMHPRRASSVDPDVFCLPLARLTSMRPVRGGARWRIPDAARRLPSLPTPAAGVLL